MKPIQIAAMTILVGILIFSGCNKDNPTQSSTMPIENEINDSTLIAYYPFNGSARDISGNLNDGFVIGATLTTDRFGMIKNSYHFVKGAYIRISELFPDSSTAFTIAVWIKKDTIDNGRHMVFYKGAQQGEVSIIFTPGVLGFGVNLHVPGSPPNTQNWYAANVTDTLKANKYYFLVARYIKGNSINLCINGKQVSTTNVPNLNLNSDLSSTFSAIGNHTEQSHSITDGWRGSIDDIRVYSRSLSNEEVQSLYHEGNWIGN